MCRRLPRHRDPAVNDMPATSVVSFAGCDRGLTVSGGLRSYFDSQYKSSDSCRKMSLRCADALLQGDYLKVSEDAEIHLIEFPSRLFGFEANFDQSCR